MTSLSNLVLPRQDRPGQFLAISGAADHDRLLHVFFQGRKERVCEAVMRVADISLAQIRTEFASNDRIDG